MKTLGNILLLPLKFIILLLLIVSFACQIIIGYILGIGELFIYVILLAMLGAIIWVFIKSGFLLSLLLFIAFIALIIILIFIPLLFAIITYKLWDLLIYRWF